MQLPGFQFPQFNVTVSKKVLWVGVGLSAVVLAGVVILGWRLKQKETVNQPVPVFRNVSIREEEPVVPTENVSVYKDPLGFSFSYPDMFNINTHPEDQENYANIELNSSKSGKIKFLVSETEYEDITFWQKNDPEVKGANFLDSKLGSLTAKKVYLEESKKLIIATVWDGMLFKIEVTPSLDQNLVRVADKIISGMNVPATANYTDGTEAAGSDISSEEELAEEEEVIE